MLDLEIQQNGDMAMFMMTCQNFEIAMEDLPALAGRIMDFYESHKPKRVDYPGSAPVREALRCIAAQDPDRAASLNGVGFSRIDGAFGHSLAKADVWSEKQLHHAKRLVRKYQRQLVEQWDYTHERIEEMCK